MNRETRPILRIKYLLFLLALVAQVSLASATVTNYVGSCVSGSYPTISAALATTPAPNFVYVCPGTYPEQVVISNPVTLEGIYTSNAGQAFITLPSGGLGTDNPCYPQAGIAQVCVSSSGTVNITNITVDGAGATAGPVGIAYYNSSGTMNHVETRFQEGEGTGIAIDINGPGTVTLENSNLHSFDFSGVFAGGNTDQTLKIEGNTIAPDTGAQTAIFASFTNSATITGNVINGPAAPVGCDPSLGYYCAGIVAIPGNAGSVSDNTVAGVGGGYAGILLLGLGDYPSTLSVTSNAIFNIAGDGIQLNISEGALPPLTIKNNIVTQAQNGINFECELDNNVNSNTITAISSYGVANVASGENSPNTYYNVPTLYSTCP